MASKWKDIGDAVVTSLNAASLSLTFTSSREYRPVHDQKTLEAATEPTVYVIPYERSSNTESRRPGQTRDYVFGIEIYRFITTMSVANVDALTDFAEEVEDHLKGAGNMSSAPWVGSTNDNPFDEEALHARNTFETVIQVTYRFVK